MTDSCKQCYLWRAISAGLAGIVLTFMSLWLSGLSKVVYREDMASYVATNSPYVKDSKFILEALVDLKVSMLAVQHRQSRIEEVLVKLESVAKR